MATEPKPADAPAFVDAGHAKTEPGQSEVVAGTPEHERLLHTHPNATSYAHDVNVVLPPKEEPAAQNTGIVPTDAGGSTPTISQPTTKASSSHVETKGDKK